MDESHLLEALENILNDVSKNPYDPSIHARHIRLTQSLEGMESETTSAMEMMTQFLAAGEEVWLPLINAKMQELDLDTEEGVLELLALYRRAESDYMCALLVSYSSCLGLTSFSYFYTPETSEIPHRKTRSI